MDLSKLTYQASGRVLPTAQVWTYVLAIPAILILAFVYSVIVYFNPFVYVTFLSTTAFGISLGYLVRLLFRFFHNRNKKNQIITTAILAFIAWYIQWAAYLFFLQEGSIASPILWLYYLPELLNPAFMVNALIQLNEFGSWNIGSIPISGIVLTLVWVIEFLIILFIPIKMVVSTKVYPYSELLSRWYPKFTISNDFPSITGTSAFVSELEEDPLATLQRLERGRGNSHAKVHIFYLKDETNQYLTIEKVRYDHKNNKVKLIVLNNFRISNEQALDLMAAFRTKKERIEIF